FLSALFHEAAVVALPLVVVAQMVFSSDRNPRARNLVREHWEYLLPTVAYLAWSALNYVQFAHGFPLSIGPIDSEKILSIFWYPICFAGILVVTWLCPFAVKIDPEGFDGRMSWNFTPFGMPLFFLLGLVLLWVGVQIAAKVNREWRSPSTRSRASL